MKKLILIAISSLTLMQSALAFNVRANVNVNPTQAAGVVYNNFDRPIICNISVVGFTQYGQRLNSYMRDVVIYRGMYGYAYVYTNYRNQFINASTNANCRWY